MPLAVECIIIGDELLSGRTNDANGPVLARLCQRIGAQLRRVHVIGDDLSEIESTLKQASQNADIVVCSGGLGPTPDDRTKNALAQLLKVPLDDHAHARALLKVHYGRLKREWTQETNHYHLIPKGVTPIHNSKGLAPGLLAKNEDAVFLFLPGVPLEFEAMLEEHLLELASSLAPEMKARPTVTIRTHGVPEEKIFGQLCPGLWEQCESFGKLSSLPHYSGVDLVISAKEQMSEEAKNQWEDDIKTMIQSSALVDYVWQWGELSLPTYLLEKCREKKWTLGFAESCTGGLASSMITDIPGSSDVFLGSIICYANEMKQSLLGVKEQTLQEHGAVSTECAQELAIGALKTCGVDMAISFSGIAGPGGGSEQKPVGTVAIAVATKDGVTSELFHFHGGRTLLKKRFAAKGMQMALKKLIP